MGKELDQAFDKSSRDFKQALTAFSNHGNFVQFFAQILDPTRVGMSELAQ